MKVITRVFGILVFACLVNLAAGGGMGGGGFGDVGMGGMGMAAMGGFGGGGGYRGGRMTLQEAISSPDEEWAVLAPKVQRILELQSQLAATGNARFAGAANPLTTTFADLYNVLVDPTQGDDVVRFRLAAYRSAVSAVQNDLKLAREDLRTYVTLRQEAILMNLGYLD